MDDELSLTLHHGMALQGSGFHKDDLASLAFSPTTPTVITQIDYKGFDREVRDKWPRL